MSDDEHNMSIMSLKHISNEQLKEDGLQNAKEKSYTTTTTINNINNNYLTSSTPKQNSQININADNKTIVFNPNSSCTSMTFFNKMSISDLGGLLNQANIDFPIDQNSVGANFLRSMLTSNQPMKNYMNFLKKESVDLTDECDAMVVMQILQKPNKSKKECDFLMKSIQGMHLFQKNKDMLTMKDCNQQLLEKLRLEYFPAKKVIFNYGDFGYTYYIVLQGAADLLIPAPVQDKENEKSKQTDQNFHKHDQKDQKYEHKDQNQYQENTPKTSSATTGLKKGKKKIKLDSKWNVLKKTFNPDQENMPFQEMQQPAIDEEQHSLLEDETHENFLKRVFPGMNYIKTFKPGEAFGEIALMTKQRRTGTLVCREGTYLMALTKESFDVILGSYHENIIQRKLNFLKTYNFFRSMPNSKLLALLHFMKVVNYRNKNIVYTENDPSRFLYFIREGEVQISQICNIEENLDKEKKKKEQGDDNPNDINAIKAQKDMRNKNKRIPIVIKGKNSYFGEDEILKHIDTRKQQAICNSESAEIFLLKKDILYNYTRGYSVIEKLKEEFKVKGEWNQIRKANIVQVKQTTKFDIEKQMNQISVKNQKATVSLNMIQEHKGLDFKQLSTSNIFSINQNKNQGFLGVPSSGSISMSNINLSGNKRQSLLNPSTSSQTPQKAGCFAIDNIDIMTSKQRLSLRTNPFNANSLNTIQRQLELNVNSKIRTHNPTSNDENENFFSTGVGQSTINGLNKDKLTPDNKVQLQLKSGRKGSCFQAASSGLIGLESNKQTPLQKQPLTLTEEENYIENKINNNLKKKYYGENQKSKEQLQQVALEQFGDMSHNAFVNKVGQTIEYKMQILKKLNSNRLQSPTNVFADLYEEFGLKKKSVNFKRRSINAGSALTPKDTNTKTFSAPNGHEFQKKIIQERKMQIKENIKKQNTLTYIEDINLICEQLPEFTPHKSRTFHQQYSYALLDANSETFIRQKSRTHTSINFNNQHQSSSQDSKKVDDKTKSFDETSLSGYESQTSQGSISFLKRNSFNEKAFKPPSLAMIKNLDVLEEVSENNSPVKSGNDLKQMRLSNLNEQKNQSQQEYGLLSLQLYQQKNKNLGSNSRVLLETINSSSQLNTSDKCGQVKFEIKPQSSGGENNSTVSSNQSTYYSSKSFMNRNTTSLKQKQEARRSIIRNSSANSKENSFKITTKQNGFLQLQKNMMCQSQGSLHHHHHRNSNSNS